MKYKYILIFILILSIIYLIWKINYQKKETFQENNCLVIPSDQYGLMPKVTGKEDRLYIFNNNTIYPGSGNDTIGIIDNYYLPAKGFNYIGVLLYAHYWNEFLKKQSNAIKSVYYDEFKFFQNTVYTDIINIDYMKVINNEHNYLITIKEDPYTLVLTFANYSVLPNGFMDDNPSFRGYRRFKITNESGAKVYPPAFFGENYRKDITLSQTGLMPPNHYGNLNRPIYFGRNKKTYNVYNMHYPILINTQNYSSNKIQFIEELKKRLKFRRYKDLELDSSDWNLNEKNYIDTDPSPNFVFESSFWREFKSPNNDLLTFSITPSPFSPHNKHFLRGSMTIQRPKFSIWTIAGRHNISVGKVSGNAYYILQGEGSAFSITLNHKKYTLRESVLFYYSKKVNKININNIHVENWIIPKEVKDFSKLFYHTEERWKYLQYSYWYNRGDRWVVANQSVSLRDELKRGYDLSTKTVCKQSSNSEPFDIKLWDVSHVTNIDNLFENSDNFNYKLNNWDLRSVTSMNNIFDNAKNFSGELNNWQFSQNANSGSPIVFNLGVAFNGKLNNWNFNDFNGVLTLNFGDNFSGDFSEWKLSNLSELNFYFNETRSISNIYRNGPSFESWSLPAFTSSYNFNVFPNGNFSNWNFENLETLNLNFPKSCVTNLSSWNLQALISFNMSFPDNFAGSYGPKILNLSKWQFDSLTVLTLRLPANFRGDFSEWKLPKLTSLEINFGDNSEANLKNWNLPKLTNLKLNFGDNFKGDLSEWNLPSVTSLSGLLKDTVGFNGNLSEWKLSSKMIDMSYMFYNCILYNNNSDLSGWKLIENEEIIDWNTGYVENYIGMFGYTKEFLENTSDDQLLSNENYDKIFENLNFKVVTNSTTNMNFMFIRAKNFNKDLTDWDITNVTTMNFMFYYATSFNGNISNWNTVNVNSMQGMFENTNSFAPIGDKNINTKWIGQDNGYLAWDTKNVTSMEKMFKDTKKFNGDISKWNTKKVTNMSSMFENAEALDNKNINRKQVEIFDLSNTQRSIYESWNTAKVTNMSSMFENAESFNSDISNWDTANVTNMSKMFKDTKNFNSDISNWNTSKVTDMSWMFYNALNFGENYDLNTSWVVRLNKKYLAWDTFSVKSMYKMFGYIEVNVLISKWNTTNVENMAEMFEGAIKFNNNISTKWVEIKDHGGNLAKQYYAWDTENVTTMHEMFDQAENFSMDISNWNTSNVTNMKEMFEDTKNFSIDLSTKIVEIKDSINNLKKTYLGWDTKNVTTMEDMFKNSQFNGNISNWNTENVEEMSGMFNDNKFFSGLKELSINTKTKPITFTVPNKPVYSYTPWITSKVTNMSKMFRNAESFNGELSNWDTSSVTDMSYMFSGAKIFSKFIRFWSINNAYETNQLEGMFNGATQLIKRYNNIGNIEDKPILLFETKYQYYLKDKDKVREWIQTVHDNKGEKKYIPASEKLLNSDLESIEKIKNMFNDYGNLTFENNNEFEKKLLKKTRNKIEKLDAQREKAKKNTREKINNLSEELNLLKLYSEESSKNLNGSLQNTYNNERINYEKIYKNMDQIKLQVGDEQTKGCLSYNNITHDISKDSKIIDCALEPTPKNDTIFRKKTINDKDEYNKLMEEVSPDFKDYATTFDDINYPFTVIQPDNDLGYCLQIDDGKKISINPCNNTSRQRFNNLNYPNKDNCDKKK